MKMTFKGHFFYRWPKLGLGLDVEAEFQILKFILWYLYKKFVSKILKTVELPLGLQLPHEQLAHEDPTTQIPIKIICVTPEIRKIVGFIK